MRWTRGVVRWRFLVIVLWLAALGLGAWSSPRLSSLLTTSVSVPGSASAQANQILIRHFHDNVEGTFTVVAPRHGGPAGLIRLEHEVARAARVVRHATLTEQRAVGSRLFVTIDTPLSLARAAAATPTLRNALLREGVSGALVTGPPALQYDLTPVLASDLHRGEVLALVLALVLLLAVLGLSWAVVVPFVVALATSGTALAVLYLLAHHVVMVLYVPNVIELISLGLAIDYSLLMVHRFRTQLRDPTVDPATALAVTMASAGRTVMVSGVAVAIGLASMLLVPVPFMRSLGVASLIVPIVSLAAATTLQPALLSLLGRRGVRAIGYRGLVERSAASPAASSRELSGPWARVARGATRRPVTTLLGALVVLAGLGYSVVWFQVTPGSLTAIPHNLPSARGLALVRADVGPGFVAPLDIVIDTGAAHRAATPAQQRAELHLAETVLALPDVLVVAIGPRAPYVDPTGRYEQILIVNSHDLGAPATQRLVARVRADVARARFPPGTHLYLGGGPAQGVDFLHALYGALPWIIAVALALAYLVLARAFRSLVIPLLAVLLDLASAASAYGVLVAVFRFGVGASWLHTFHVSQLEGWVPIFIFAVLFGLSMDYEVFIVARVREARDRGATTRDAIVEGLATTGAVVTSAAVIMVGAVSGLVLGHVAGLQELGVGLAAGVLVDATLVRGLMLPSAMALLGRANWWMPRPAAWLLHVAPSPPRGAHDPTVRPTSSPHASGA